MNTSTQLDKMEYKLKQVWQQAEATKDAELKAQLRAEYRKQHEIYKKQLILMGLK
jgi:hypothetical protein